MRWLFPTLVLAAGLLGVAPVAAESELSPLAAPGSVQEAGPRVDLIQWWLSLPEETRQLLQRGKRDFEALSPDRQQRIHDRWHQYQQLTPAEQQRLRDRYQHWQSLPEEERYRLRKTFKKFKQLPPEEREQLRLELRRIEQLPAEQRRLQHQQLRQRYFPEVPGPAETGRGQGVRRAPGASR